MFRQGKALCYVSGVLSGLRVIDCGTYIAGPAAAVVLSDFGAEVIKIERPPYGDPYRYLPQVPGMPVSEQNYCWILDGRNKKSVALNLADEAGREALLKLVTAADVFITNYQPSLVKKFRLSYSELRPVNPRLIYAHITGYGEAGADAEKPGYDLTAYWARSGLMSSMHNGDAEPVQSAAGIGDHPTSMTVVAGVMLGLYRREITGRGMEVSTSLMANGAWAHSCAIQAALVGAKFLPKWTRKTAVNPAINHYVTADGQRLITCCLDPKKDWPNLCRALGRPDLTDDPRFSTPALRQANSAELVAMIDLIVGAKTLAEWERLFREYDVIWSLVPSPVQVAMDPQMEANGVFAQIPDGPKTILSPLNVEGEEKRQPSRAPDVGEHTAEVLKSVGYDDAAIEALVARGAAALSPPPKTIRGATGPNK